MTDSDVIKKFPQLSHLGVTREEVEYEFESDKDAYGIKQGPAFRVFKVTSSSGATTYTEGTDYDLVLDADGNIKSIDWGIGGDSPSDGEIFVVDQEFEAILSRYLRAHDEQFDELKHDFDVITLSRQIDNASGDNLDRIGAIFGVLGRRAGRDDDDYQIFLKSIVQSFAGRGSVPGLRFAAAAGLGVSIDKIGIDEDFNNLEYDITVEDWPAHRGSIIEELTDLADPSVVDLNLIRYPVEDSATVTDKVRIPVAIKTDEDVTTDDSVFIDPDLTTTTDSAAGNDVVVTSINTSLNWGDNWGTMTWTAEQD